MIIKINYALFTLHGIIICIVNTLRHTNVGCRQIAKVFRGVGGGNPINIPFQNYKIFKSTFVLDRSVRACCTNIYYVIHI